MTKRSRIILTAVPIVAGVAGVATYSIVQILKSKDQNLNENPKPLQITQTGDDGLLSKFQIFPKLLTHDFYKYIRVRNGEGYMDDVFVAQVLNKILKDLQISEGSLRWGYDLSIDGKSLKVSIIWMSPENQREYSKTYSFTISKDV